MTPPDMKTQNHLREKGNVYPSLLKSAAVLATGPGRGKQKLMTAKCQQTGTTKLTNKIKVRSLNEC